MPHLSLSLLGSFQATIDSQPVTGWKSAKIKALLAYLAVEADRPHTREALAGLLWPDYPNSSALNNLRDALSALRQTIGDRQAAPPFLLITRDQIQFNRLSDYDVDVIELIRLTSGAERSLSDVQVAVALFHGRFLEGFTCDSAPFEEWTLLKHEQAQWVVINALRWLSGYFENHNEYDQAINYARKQLELEPWDEAGHRQLMRAQALSGQRSAALAQFESCRRLLASELSVDPSAETISLYESIRDQTFVLPFQPPAVESAPGANPYKGLRPFQEADAPDFFGRQALIEVLLDRLAPADLLSESQPLDGRFLAIVGPSGSGKSSLIKAGLLPALSQGRLPGSEKWLIIEMLPESDPWDELEIGLLRKARRPHDGFAEPLRRDERGLIRAARMALTGGDDILLLVIDQFEELFTLVEDQTEVERFLSAIYTAVTDPRSPVRVIVGLRADFYDRPLIHPEFSRLLDKGVQIVTPLSTLELEQAILGPAERSGVEMESGLLSEIIADIYGQPGGLPLLQYALTDLFEHREGRTLTRKAYASIGGVRGALGRRAEQIYSGLTAAGQAAAQQIFLRLTSVGEGSEDTRRRVSLSELHTLFPRPGLSEPPEVVTQFTRTFSQARLLSFDRDPVTLSPTIEVAHEALFREWSRLHEWLETNRADLRMQRLLHTASAEWTGADRDTSFLLHGARLDQFAGWSANARLALTQDEQAFLSASLAEQQRQAAQEDARRQHELVTAQTLAEAERQRAETEQRRAEDQTHAAARLRRQAAYLALALLVAAVLGGMAGMFAYRANRDARIATSRELANAAVNNLAVDPERSLLLALYGLNAADTLEARNALRQSLPAQHQVKSFVAHDSTVTGLAFSPDGKLLASASSDSTAKIWNAQTGELMSTVTPFDKEIWDVAFSPDGNFLAVSSLTQVAIVNPKTGVPLYFLKGKEVGWQVGFDLGVGHIDFSPDGTRLAVANLDGTPAVVDLSTRAVIRTFSGNEAICKTVDLSPDGRLLAVGCDDGVVRVWDAATGKLEYEHIQPGEIWLGIHFSPDGSQLAAASEGSSLVVWDSVSSEELMRLARPETGGFRGVLWSPDGKSLATPCYDGVTRIWDAAAGMMLLNLPGHVSTVAAIALSPDGARLATGGVDKSIKVWDTGPGKEYLTINTGANYTRVDFNSDGSQLVTSNSGGAPQIWDAATGALLRTLPGIEPVRPLTSIVYSPDGKRVAAGSGDGFATIWDSETGQIALSWKAHTNTIAGIDFSRDGKRLVTSSNDGYVTVWDAATGQSLVKFDGHVKHAASPQFLFVFDVAFSPDGTRVASAGYDGAVRVWDASNGQEIFSVSDGKALFSAVAFSPDGKLLAAGEFDAPLLIADAATGQVLHRLTGHSGAILDLAFSPDGRYIASASFDKLAKLWDAYTGQEISSFYGNASNAWSVSYSPDGKRVAVGGWDGTARIFVVPLDELVVLAKSRLTRSLAEAECQKYLHLEKCPEMP